MTALVDAGPLISIITGDGDAAFFASALDVERGDLLTTDACLTEAFHLVGRKTRWTGTVALFDLIEGAKIESASVIVERSRARSLMAKYANMPMDFADVSLVLLAEVTGIGRIITADRRDFSTYRIHDRKAFEVIAPPSDES